MLIVRQLPSFRAVAIVAETNLPQLKLPEVRRAMALYTLSWDLYIAALWMAEGAVQLLMLPLQGPLLMKVAPGPALQIMALLTVALKLLLMGVFMTLHTLFTPTAKAPTKLPFLLMAGDTGDRPMPPFQGIALMLLSLETRGAKASLTVAVGAGMLALVMGIFMTLLATLVGDHPTDPLRMTAITGELLMGAA